MRYEFIEVNDLVLDENNVRDHYVEIRELAESIFHHGLLQNLVVRAHPEKRGKFIVEAGNRRLKAILRLIEQGRWPPEGTSEEKVLCLVKDEGRAQSWAQLVENLLRKNVAPWRLGARLAEIVEAGYSQLDIAERLNISSGSVSNYIRISRGLHPDLIVEIERLGPETLTIPQYLQISRAVNEETLRPDYKAQRALFESFLSTKKVSKRQKSTVVSNRNKPERVYQRLNSIMTGHVPIPLHAQPYANALLSYLNGTTNRLIFPPPPERL